jgi:hypothetical protein
VDRTQVRVDGRQRAGGCHGSREGEQVLDTRRIIRGVLVAAVLGCAPLGSVQEPPVAPQLSIEQAQRWCFQYGLPTCQGEWRQLQPNRVQFSNDNCNAVFIVPAVLQQTAQGRMPAEVVIIDSNPPEIVAQAHHSANLRVLINVCMIVLEAR